MLHFNIILFKFLFSIRKLFTFISKYYPIDVGHPHMMGYLNPYKEEQYHLLNFQHGSQPREKEIFNHNHSSLRCTNERTFRVWKNRWKILHLMLSFNFENCDCFKGSSKVCKKICR